MATATSEEQQQNRSDLLICPVCLENMVERHPRFLRCLHTFCQSCLEQCEVSVVNRCLECPLCKAETIIPEEGVKGLPLNFQLKQFSEILEEPSGVLDNCGICLFKKKKVQAVSFCKECEQLLCKDCENRHNAMFKQHLITPRISDEGMIIRCDAHSAVMKYYCSECKVCLCPVCMMTQNHLEHQDKTVSIEKANDAVQCTVSKYIDKLESFNRKLEPEIKEKLAVSDSLKEIAEQIRETGSEQKKIIDQLVTALISDLDNNYTAKVEESIAKHQNVISSIHEMMDLLTNISMGEMIRIHADVSGKIESLEKKVENVHQETPQLIIPVFTPAKHTVGTLETAEHNTDMKGSTDSDVPERDTRPDSQRHELLSNASQCSGHESLTKCIQLTKSDIEIKYPSEIVILQDNSVIFSDTGLYHVTRLDQQGRVIRTYTPDEDEDKIDCMCLSGDTVYIVHNNHLTTFVPKQDIPLYTTRCLTGFEGETIRSVAVDKNKNTYIGNTSGQVFILRPGSCMRKQITYIGKEHDAYVSIADLGDREVLVACDPTADRVFFTDTTTGRRLARIDGPLDTPYAATGTPRGTILIADSGNDRIAEYTLDGDCLGYPLTCFDGLSLPVGIAYKHPYMWIIDNDPYHDCRCIKMYMYQ